MNRIKAGLGQSRPDDRRRVVLHRQPTTGPSACTTSSPIRSRPRASIPRWRRTTTSRSCSPRDRSSSRPGSTSASVSRSRTAPISTELRRHGRDRAADLQRELSVRSAAADADGDRRDRRRVRAALVGRRRRARRRPGDAPCSTSRATASIARPIPSSAIRRSSRTARAPAPSGNGKPIAQFDLVDGKTGASRARRSRACRYWLGSDTGITHTWTDTTVTNGQQYYYAVCAYDFGFETGRSTRSPSIPSENAIARLAHAARRHHPADERRPGAPEPARRRATSARVDSRGARRPATASGTVQRPGRRTRTSFRDGHVVPRRLSRRLRPDSVRATQLRAVRQHRRRTRCSRTAPTSTPPASGRSATGCCRWSSPLAKSRVDTAPPGSIAGQRHQHAAQGRSTSRVLSPTCAGRAIPDDITIMFDDVVGRHRRVAVFPDPAQPAKFRVIAHTDSGDQPARRSASATSTATAR